MASSEPARLVVTDQRPASQRMRTRTPGRCLALTWTITGRLRTSAPVRVMPEPSDGRRGVLSSIRKVWGAPLTIWLSSRGSCRRDDLVFVLTPPPPVLPQSLELQGSPPQGAAFEGRHLTRCRCLGEWSGWLAGSVSARRLDR